MSKLNVVYHSPCTDGFGAAFAIWLYHMNYRPQQEINFVPASYSDPAPELEEGTDVLVVDVSWSREEILRMKARANTFCLLDHHARTGETLLDIENVFYEADESGATFAWKFLYETPVPLFFRYIRDADLWQWKLPKSREFSAALASYPMTFEAWNGLYGRPMADILAEGEAILRYQQQVVESLMDSEERAWFNVDGTLHRVPVMACPGLLASVAGNTLLAKHPEAEFAAVYYRLPDGKRKWSVRSEDSRMSAREVAEAFGGGGHRNAAGFVETYKGEFIIVS
jgi:uncharacterized protein